jgi:hypothetical protein
MVQATDEVIKNLANNWFQGVHDEKETYTKDDHGGFK